MAVKGYSGQQVALHWVFVILIGFQFVFHDAIEHSWHAIQQGQEAAFSPGTLAHVVVGISVLLLLLPRAWLRMSRGVPQLPEDEPKFLARIADATHLAFYGLLLALPLTGLVAWFGGVAAAATAHDILRALLILLFVLHVLGAFYQQFVLKTDVLRRMLSAEN